MVGGWISRYQVLGSIVSTCQEKVVLYKFLIKVTVKSVEIFIVQMTLVHLLQ